MPEVGAEERHCDDVEENGRPKLEAGNDHAVNVVAGRAIGHRLGEAIVVVSGANGKVEDVENDEGKNREPAHRHDSRRNRCLDGAFLCVFGASRCAVHPHELERRRDVEDERHEKTDPSDPDASSVEHAVEEFCVIIHGILTGIHEEIASKVPSKKEDEDDAAKGDDHFFADGRSIEPCGSSEGGHKRGEKREK